MSQLNSVSELIEQRALVRIVVMRGTIHLVTADDCLLLPIRTAELRRHRDHAPRLERVDLAPVLASARELLAEPCSSGCGRGSSR